MVGRVLALSLLSMCAVPALASAVPLTPSPASHDFGNVNRYAQSPQQNFTFTNLDPAPVTVTSVGLAPPDAADFTITSDGCNGQVLNQNNSCDVSVATNPTSTGPKTTSLDVQTDAVDTASVPLSANAQTGTVDVNLNPIAFNVQPYFFGTQQANINVAAQTFGVQLGNATLTGPDAASFSLAYNGCDNQLLQQQGNQCNLGVGFSPTGPTGPLNANLQITSDSASNPTVIPITAQALAGPIPQISPSAHDFGPVAFGSTAGPQTFTMTNVGDFPAQVQQILIISGAPQMFPVTDDNCTFAIVNPGENCTFKIAFTPTSAGEKEGSIFMITNSPSPVTRVSMTGQGFAPPGANARVVGVPEVGRTLECATSEVSGSLAFRWFREGESIDGARDATYVPTNADFDSRLACRVTASNAVGETTVDSGETELVGPRNLSGDSRSLVNRSACRVVGIDPIDGVKITGTDPATPDSPLTFTSPEEIDVELGSLSKTGTHVRFTPRELSGLSDGPQDVAVDGESSEAVLAPCRLSTQVNGAPSTRTIYAISGSAGIERGSITTPKLRIATSKRLTGQATISTFDEPVVRFPLRGKTTNFNGIKVEVSKHGVEFSGLPVDTATAQVRFGNRVISGSGGDVQAEATLRSVVRDSGAGANVKSSWG